MRSTVFNSGTIIASSWLNDVNDAVYNGDFPTPLAAAGIQYNEGGTGAVTTTVAAKLQQIVSVMDFGATGNGTTDDTAAFQAAIAACGTNGASLYVPVGNYYITSTLTTPNTTATGLGFTIYGDGYNSKLIFNTTSDCISITVNGVGFQNYNVVIKDLHFTNQTNNPNSFIHNNKPVNTLIEGCHFTNATVTYCIVNDNAYGMCVKNCVFFTVTGIGVYLAQVADISTYSYVNSILNCDFSVVTNAIQVEGCDCLLVQSTVMEVCSTAFQTTPQNYSTTAFNITFDNCWFERNTVNDINLGSSSSYWSEANIRNCQFSGLANPSGGNYPCTIALGVKSKVTIEGTPSGNTVTVSGSADAAAVLIRATNFNQSGSFAWTSIDPYGNITANTYQTLSGTYASPASGTAVTLTTLPNVNVGVWLATAACAEASASVGSAVSIICVQNTTSTATAIKTASQVSISTSGNNLQATQTTGIVYSIQWTITRIA